MPTTTASQVVLKLKAVFARFGCPDQAISDNGPHFACEEFREFAREYNFEHITASPHNPQGNGHAERGVQIAKTILKQKDPLLPLMCYHSTPCTSTGASPAELLMGRKIKTTLPTLEKNLPRWPNLKAVRSKDTKEKEKQAFYFNLRHGAKPLPSLRPGDPVLVKLDHQHAWGTTAVITGDSTTPRSYVIETQQGTTMRHNRHHLQHVPVPTGDTPRPPDGQLHDTATQQPNPVIITDSAPPTPKNRPPPA